MTMKRAALALTCLLPLIASCGPIPVAQAEKICLERARLAQQPRGSVAVGANSNGQIETAFDVTISADYLQGRDPSDVFNGCVKGRSGQFPSTPLYAQPGWNG
jgi:hypothetical protein